MINPYGMTLRDWADAVVLLTEPAWSLGRLDDESDWQNWAVGLVRASPVSQRAPPNPFQFNDWREWAQLAYPMLEGQS